MQLHGKDLVMTVLRLVSHSLCPYVQRAVIAMREKGVPFERVDIDLADKPDWFLRLSPFGKTPVLEIDGNGIFESAAILEYLEETQERPLHPSDPRQRAEHRGWIEFSSAVLADIAGFYSAPDAAAFEVERQALIGRFARLEARVRATPYFDGADFSLVDAVFGPVFRYIDVFDAIDDFGFLAARPKLARWRQSLRERDSIATAVSRDYPLLLREFIARRESWLSHLQASAARRS
jgi:glutathione S-transferase